MKGPEDQITTWRMERRPRAADRGFLSVLASWSLGFFVAGMVGPILPAAESVDRPTVMIVAGAHGDEEFAADFELQVTNWIDVSRRAGAEHVLVGADPVQSGTDRERLQQALADEPKEGNGELWIVVIGHGTFDGREAKLNLRGPDVSATEMAEWLQPFRRPLAIVITTSASAPFMSKLSGEGRVVVTSTRSGHEHNYARFGKFLAEALPDPRSDLDKDGQISLLEAFLSASHRTAEFYQAEGRLATEHALIDDNGDGLGTPADWFKGVRATKRARDGATLDGARAHQFHLVRSHAEQQLSGELRAQRDQLELEVAKLRERKLKMAEDVYYRELEKLMLQLAALYDRT
jgi:hypothetical protein